MQTEIHHSQHKPDKLRALGIMALNGMFDEMDGLSVLRQAATEVLDGDVAIVSSFGADSAVLLHMVSQVDPTLPVFFLETGKHFPETLVYVETLKQRLGLSNVRALVPDTKDIARFDPDGDLWETDPDSCCHIRKTEPLDIVLEEFGGWVTGRKRYQTTERGVLPHFELTSDDRIKVNPLAYWTNTDIDAYKAEHDLPDHPLYGEGYKSIGCAPCTSAVAEGEDPRAGRWRGLNKKECGIHFDFNGKIAAPTSTRPLNLYKDHEFIADPFRQWAEGDDAASVRYTHVPLAVFLADREAFLDNQAPLGLVVSPADRIEDAAADIHRFSSIAIEFPAFTDGRGYSTARLLRERLSYQGEMRAIGDVLQDQINFMRRCGFDAFVVSNAATRKALEDDAIAAISVFMQPTASQREVPAGTRPFLRRATETEIA